jgi:DNA-binding MarR family transcriptional regulator
VTATRPWADTTGAARGAARSADADAPTGFIGAYLPYLLARASHLVSGEFHEHLRANGVPVMHWRVMASLWDGPKSVREVADIILQQQPTVSKLLGRMQRQGLVGRATDAADRRRSVVSLTRLGRARAGPLIDAARAHEAALLLPFGARHAATLVDVLQRLIDQHAHRAR